MDSNCPGKETWKNHPLIPGLKVSNLGKARLNGRDLTARQTAGTYYSRIFVPGHGRFRRHRLVAETWLGAKPGECVLHRDEERPLEFVDAVDNLWLGTRQENAKDRDQKGRLRGKKKNFIPEQTRQKVHALRKLGLITREVGDILGIGEKSAGNILRRDPDLNVYV